MDQVRTNIFLPEEQRDWLKEQPGPMAETVREAIDFYRDFGRVVDAIREVDPQVLIQLVEEFKGQALNYMGGLEGQSVSAEQVEKDRSMLTLQLLILHALKTEE
jgi:hypothetical protein